MDKDQTTILSMLAGDGVVTATFRPVLSAEQYSELLGIARNGFETSQELCDAIQGASAKWGVECIIDGCCTPRNFAKKCARGGAVYRVSAPEI
jgi:hypothetical protein